MGLQHLAHGNQSQYHGCGLKIKLMHIGHNAVHVHIDLCYGHGEQGVGAVPEGRAGAQGHQSIHVRCAVKQALEAVDEELLVDDHDDDRQQKLGQAHGYVIVHHEAWYRPAPHHMPHGQVHKRRQEYQRRNQSSSNLRGLGVLQEIVVSRRGRFRAAVLRAFLGSTVSRCLHRRDDGGRLRGSLYSHGIG